MKKIIFIVFAIFASTFTFSQVGIGTQSPHSSSILDLTATNKALLLPRVANTAAIASPVNGMMIYDMSSNCIKSYENNAWSPCFGAVVGISSLNCSSPVNTGSLTSGVIASGVSSEISYDNGNGSSHTGQVVTSTGVTGLTATLSAGNFATGPGTLTYTISGTPSSDGIASFAINIGGQTCTLTRAVNVPIPTNPVGAGSFVGKTCFDVASSNDNENGCGALTLRTINQADFTQTSTNTQTYVFTPSGTVSNVRFIAYNVNGEILQSITGGNSGNNITTPVTATVNYFTNINPSAVGLTSSDALSATIYVVYNDGATNNGTDRQLQLVANVKDCACTLPSSNTGWNATFVNADGNVYHSGWSSGLGHTGAASDFIELNWLVTKVPILNTSSGYYHTIMLSRDLEVYGFGNSGYRQLGAATPSPKGVIKPTIPLNAGEKIAQITAGYYHSTLLSTQGRLFNSGYNAQGQLGNGTITQIDNFTLVDLNHSSITSQNGGVAPVPVSIFNGGDCSFFVDSQGNLWGTGGNANGKLGIGNNTYQSRYQKVSFGANKVALINTTQYNTVVLLDNGQVWVAGDRNYGIRGSSGTTGNSNVFEPLLLDGAAASEPIGTIVNINLANSYDGGSRLYLYDSNGKLFVKGVQVSQEFGNNTGSTESTTFQLCNISALNGEQILQIKSVDWVTHLITTSGKIFGAGRNAYNELLFNPNTNASGAYPIFTQITIPFSNNIVN